MPLLALSECSAIASNAMVPAELFQKAQVRDIAVIVLLRTPQRASPDIVTSLKRQVLGEIAETRHRLLRDLSSVPQLAIEASEETLRALAASPNVVRVDEVVAHEPLR